MVLVFENCEKKKMTTRRYDLSACRLIACTGQGRIEDSTWLSAQPTCTKADSDLLFLVD